MFKISGIRKLNDFFNYSHNKAYGQLYSPRIQAMMKQDKKFRNIILYERKMYDENGKPKPCLERENLIFTKLMNLNYMGQDKI